MLSAFSDSFFQRIEQFNLLGYEESDDFLDSSSSTRDYSETSETPDENIDQAENFVADTSDDEVEKSSLDRKIEALNIEFSHRLSEITDIDEDGIMTLIDCFMDETTDHVKYLNTMWEFLGEPCEDTWYEMENEILQYLRGLDDLHDSHSVADTVSMSDVEDDN